MYHWLVAVGVQLEKSAKSEFPSCKRIRDVHAHTHTDGWTAVIGEFTNPLITPNDPWT